MPYRYMSVTWRGMIILAQTVGLATCLNFIIEGVLNIVISWKGLPYKRHRAGFTPLHFLKE